MCLFIQTCAATPAPADKLEKNGKEAEKEEDKEEGEATSDKEKVKDKDEGKDVDGNRTADPEEVGHGPQNSRHLTAKTTFCVNKRSRWTYILCKTCVL